MHWRRKWQPTPVFLPGDSQGQRSLVGYHLWGYTESDTTERLQFHFSLSHIGEGSGTPLQCSCLENPKDREASWAAVYGVVQSRTELKRLSSSSRQVSHFLVFPVVSPMLSFADFSMLFTFVIFLKHSLWRRKWQFPVFLPGESHGQGSLAGCCP